MQVNMHGYSVFCLCCCILCRKWQHAWQHGDHHTHAHAVLPAFTCPQIVLLNMLIVMMREIYVKVRETEHDVFLRGRAELIVEVETLMSKSQRERYSLMPPFLHLLSQVRVHALAAQCMSLQGTALLPHACLPAISQPGERACLGCAVREPAANKELLWTGLQVESTVCCSEYGIERLLWYKSGEDCIVNSRKIGQWCSPDVHCLHPLRRTART
eukprot:1160142-Pelagomonas_calceolata.AAC.37